MITICDDVSDEYSVHYGMNGEQALHCFAMAMVRIQELVGVTNFFDAPSGLLKKLVLVDDDQLNMGQLYVAIGYVADLTEDVPSWFQSDMQNAQTMRHGLCVGASVEAVLQLAKRLDISSQLVGHMRKGRRFFYAWGTTPWDRGNLLRGYNRCLTLGPE